MNNKRINELREFYLEASDDPSCIDAVEEIIKALPEALDEIERLQNILTDAAQGCRNVIAECKQVLKQVKEQG